MTQFAFQAISDSLFRAAPALNMEGLTDAGYAVIIALAYAVGSIPFGYIIVRLRGGGDVRATGSGGTGATNVSRRAGVRAGVLTLALDALKGVVALALAQRLVPNGAGADWVVAIAGFAAIVGHCFPVWLKFRGGKGVATALGVFLILAPLAVLCALVAFAVVVRLTRYVSLGSIVAAFIIPLAVALTPHWMYPAMMAGALGSFQPVFVAAFASSALVIFMHRANIKRLLNGAENKFGERTSDAPSSQSS